ncbi:MAG: hypothetical protein LBE84_12100 [Planctomycetota bacterium]|jgi:membrane protease YdiL (CAAX protease family)|nr:hypothetical protein [Planctomycetota bacterium]
MRKFRYDNSNPAAAVVFIPAIIFGLIHSDFTLFIFLFVGGLLSSILMKVRMSA